MSPTPRTWQPSFIDWEAVQAVVFDLGNVIVDLDVPATERGWRTLLGDGYTAFRDWASAENLWSAYEKGQLTQDAFHEAIVQQVEGRLSPKQVTDHWNTILVGIGEHRFSLLRALRERLPIYVLSNTNQTHIEWVRKHVAELGEADFEGLFDRVYYSHELGLAKPDSAIYTTVQQDIGLPPGSLLFIDDLAENVAAAQACGWQAVQLPIPVDVQEVFAEAAPKLGLTDYFADAGRVTKGPS